MSLTLKRILGVSLVLFLLGWGGYGLLMYLSVLVHQLVLVDDATRESLMQLCGGGSPLCQGLHALLPFIAHSIGRLSPFLWFTIISMSLYAIAVGVRYARTKEWTIRMRMKPWHVYLLFLGSLWLIFTTLTLGFEDGFPIRRLVEPTEKVYQGLTPETLQSLKENYQDLYDKGCLEYVGTSQVGADVYDMRIACIQMSFIARVMTQVILVTLFLFELLVLGRMFLHLVRVRPENALVEFIVSAAAGACCLIAILWVAAIAHVYVMAMGWLLLLAIPLVGWRHARYWIQSFAHRSWEVNERWYSPVIPLAWLLLAYLAFNFLTVVRPFPIGWDDLGRYLNHPRLLVSYGHFIPSLATFSWEYLTSLGFLLFGFDTVVGATFSMFINWSAGLLATLGVYAFARTLLGARRGLLAALIYYTLPLVGHFSFADMKVDNAAFTMGMMSMFCLFFGLFPTAEEDETHVHNPLIWWRWILLAGFFGGFAFAMKLTSVMVLMALATVIMGITIHWAAFPGAALLGWAFYTKHGEFNVRSISQYVYGDPAAISRPFVYALCIGFGLLFFAYAFWRKRESFATGFKTFGIFCAGIIAAMLPWLIYNNIASGNVIPGLVTGAPDLITPVISIIPPEHAPEGLDVRSLPPELRPDPNNPACKSTSKAEEVDRYWGTGYGKGWSHYLTLPWRSVMNLDSAGYYVTTMPALLLFPLLLFMPFFWSRRGRALRWLFAVTLLILVQWVFFANGIPWYGLGIFLGIAVSLEALVTRGEDRWSRWIAGAFVALSLLMCLNMRLWQFEQQRNLLEYPMGKVSAEAIRKRTIPHYDLIRDIVLQRRETMPERPYTYRVGTFIPYFIPKNLENLPFSDNQLDFFNCLHQERDPELTLKRFQAFGFSSIIFDTNTHTIEKDPNGTLHKKVELFLNFLNTPTIPFQAIVNDTAAGVAFVLLP